MCNAETTRNLNTASTKSTLDGCGKLPINFKGFEITQMVRLWRLLCHRTTLIKKLSLSIYRRESRKYALKFSTVVNISRPRLLLRVFQGIN